MTKQIIRITTRISLWKIIVRWLTKVYLGCSAHNSLVELWGSVILQRVTHRGTVDSIAWIKLIRLCYTRFLAGQPFDKSPGLGIKLDINGLPENNPLNILFLSRDATLLRFGFTLLGISRILPGWKQPDLAPITTPGPIKSEQLCSEAQAIVKELKWKLSLPRWEACHVSTKSGPNAQAMLGSVEDAHLLPDAAREFIRVLGGDAIILLIDTIRLIQVPIWLAHFKLKPGGSRGKLSLVRDKEAKCRIVAILDYWSQSVLKPLHAELFSLLKSLRPDCTFNQGSFRAKLSKNGPYYSFDLSSATDRMPVWLQAAVLSELTNKEYSEAWVSLIIDRDYKCNWGRRATVRYACGQPMGAYSSWAMFAVTHHAIVRMAAKRAGKPVSFSNYVLLGDDIVIGDHDVAAQYRIIISLLGVEISSAKTHVSSDTYEFAKRWIYKGNEVTGAPMGSFFEAIRISKDLEQSEVVPTKRIAYISYYGVVTWLRELEARWMPLSSTMVSRSMLAGLFILMGRSGLADRLAQKAWRFFCLPAFEDGRALRRTKTRFLAFDLLGDILTCNSGRDAITRVLVFLNECKARVIEDAIKRQMGKLQQFQLKLSSFLDLVPEGLDAQSLLLSLPPLAAVRQNIAQLQLEFDKAHLVRESENIAHWLWLDVRLFLDPEEALSARKSKTAAMSKATIMNHLTAMCRGVCKMRAYALGATFPSTVSDDSQIETIARTVNSYVCLPTAGRRRKAARPSRSNLKRSGK